MPLDSCRVHGHPLLLPTDAQESTAAHSNTARSEDASNSEALETNKDELTWGNVWREMKTTRTFRALGPGLSRVACLHPFCAKPEVQRAVWQHASDRVAEMSSVKEDGTYGSGGSFPSFEHLLGLPLHSFSEMDAPLVEAIWDWRLGWTPLLAQLPALDQHPRCLVTFKRRHSMPCTSLVHDYLLLSGLEKFPYLSCAFPLFCKLTFHCTDCGL